MRLALLPLAAALLACPGVASAAAVNSTGSEILYQGDIGEQSNAEVSLSDGGTQFDFVERRTSLQAGLGCTQVETPAGSGKTGEVKCPTSGAAKVTFDLRDGDDSLLVSLPDDAPAPLAVSGGDGLDLVSYAGGLTPVSVSLDDAANDGPEGRGDNIGTDVEDVTGTGAADVLTGDAQANRFLGGAGADTYAGDAGDDLFETAEPAPERDTVACGAGVDIVDGDKLDQIGPDCEVVARDSRVDLTSGPDTFKLFRSGLSVYGHGGNDVITGFSRDRIDGGKGRDRLNGGSGVDVLTGGRGRDKLFGGSGDDTIRARDGERDTVSCGKGRDVVKADRRDRVLPGCESVSRR